MINLTLIRWPIIIFLLLLYKENIRYITEYISHPTYEKAIVYPYFWIYLAIPGGIVYILLVILPLFHKPLNYWMIFYYALIVGHGIFTLTLAIYFDKETDKVPVIIHNTSGVMIENLKISHNHQVYYLNSLPPEQSETWTCPCGEYKRLTTLQYTIAGRSRTDTLFQSAYSISRFIWTFHIQKGGKLINTRDERD